MSKTVLVKQLRDATYASFLDCAQALAAQHGDFDKALEQLQAANIGKAAKKAERATSEGLVIVRQNATSACSIELNCETDFVARTLEFKTLAHQIAEQVLRDPSLISATEALASDWPTTPGQTLELAIKDLVGKLGENIQLGRVARYDQPATGVIEGYVHAGAIEGFGPYEGRLGVLIELATATPIDDQSQLQAVAHSLALQIASNAPLYISKDHIPAAELAEQHDLIASQLHAVNKPDAIKAKIMAGRLGKFYLDTCLLEQEYLMDDNLTVADWLAQNGETLGTRLQIVRFERFELNH